MFVDWMPCDCPAARASSRLGHHWIKCLTAGCTSVWYEPAAQAERPRSCLASSISRTDFVRLATSGVRRMARPE
jgi:hypothetical protein